MVRMKSQLILTFLIFSICCDSNSQNLLSNGDFEDYFDFPSTTGQYYYAIGWNALNGNGTPDYFHMMGSGQVQLPNSSFANVTPHNGNAVMGIGFYSPTTEFREYISKQLIDTMTIGQEYEISFWLSNGDSLFGSEGGCDHFGIFLSTYQPQQSVVSPLNIAPQLEIPGVIWFDNWTQFTFNFVADSAYEYITFGNFYPDSLTTIINFLNINGVNNVYYFIDDIIVQTPEEVIPEFELVIPTAITPNGDNINDVWELNGVDEHYPNNVVRIYNRWGNLLFESQPGNYEETPWDGTFNAKKLTSGSYYFIIETSNLEINDISGSLVLISE